MRRIATVKYGSSTPPLERAALKIIFQFDCSDISSHPSSSLPSPTLERELAGNAEYTATYSSALFSRTAEGGGDPPNSHGFRILLQAIPLRRPCDRRNRARLL